MPGQDLRDSSEGNEVTVHVCVPEEADVIDLLKLECNLVHSMPDIYGMEKQYKSHEKSTHALKMLTNVFSLVTRY